MRLKISIISILLALTILALPGQAPAQVAVGISVTIAPPDLPVYDQPICPGDDYIWTPGYWAYDDDGYYWVPGTWVLAPEVGLFWTPGYWAWEGNGFFFHEGYWGPEIGFYGGIDYGFGYFGHGYEGGRWDQGHFFYNRSVNNVDVTIVHNVYNTTVINRTTTVKRVSFNGGNGGTNERPRPEEEAAARARHIPPVAAQTQHVQVAKSNRELRVSANQGMPPIAATPKPGAFSDRQVVRAKEAGTVHSPAPNSQSKNVPANNAIHPNDMHPAERPAAPNTGNPKQDQKYQQEQEKLQAKQEQERQQLQQKQDKDHQRMEQQKADEAKKQQLEQQHQRQTQQLAEKHAQEMQKMQERQQPPPPQNHPKPPKPNP